ncbi:helix-turn-helix transcriptional regulator [Williamsia sterculiae]|uniref:Helix-turn-helix domain-containing protein n=1 Tax=Williamsia sterculiae TaxID=1344003 RepID=A0A1N7FH10_9NOCA|nr:helix-turn-helix transcriptional regulator [Williamsia sterculiae]SIR99718.1 Helix-turn-helix domain-containing protein [Williamsia sterculiae]
MDRTGLAEFLRHRREALQPEDVGLPRGVRRRTTGLRREEVAALAGMSTDYYSRIEQQRGPQPSDQMLAAIARALHLTLDERDHLFRLAGQNTPQRVARGDHVSPGMMRILDRLGDTPAQVINGAGETLIQTEPARALFGDHAEYTGLRRSVVYRWFTDAEQRARIRAADHDRHARAHAGRLRQAVTREGPGSRAAAVSRELLSVSDDFARIWAEHDISVQLTDGIKHLVHPELGAIEVHCQVLLDPDQTQSLLVYTATPGSSSHEKLAMLAAIM